MIEKDNDEPVYTAEEVNTATKIISLRFLGALVISLAITTVGLLTVGYARNAGLGEFGSVFLLAFTFAGLYVGWSLVTEDLI